MLNRLINALMYFLFSALGKEMPKCEKCKTVMKKAENPCLFLIPIFHDHDYTPSKEYYLANCTRIDHVREIPTGQRACRFWELTCPECSHKKILVEDFLKVRDTEVVEKRNLYDRDDFYDFIIS